MTTKQICDHIIKPKTVYTYLKPDEGVSYCDYLCAGGLNNNVVGIATVFVSHAWKSSFLDVVDALIDHFHDNLDVIIWFDLFSKNQNDKNRIQSIDWYDVDFKELIKEIGNVVMVLTPWMNPFTLKRTWCLYELYCAVELKDHNVKFDIVMCKMEKDQLMEFIINQSQEFLEVIHNIQVSKHIILVNVLSCLYLFIFYFLE